MDHNGEVVESRESHNTIIPTESAILCQAGKMTVKANVILNKRFKVLPVLPHVIDWISPMVKMISSIPIELVTKGTEQTVAITCEIDFIIRKS